MDSEKSGSFFTSGELWSLKRLITQFILDDIHCHGPLYSAIEAEIKKKKEPMENGV